MKAQDFMSRLINFRKDRTDEEKQSQVRLLECHIAPITETDETASRLICLADSSGTVNINMQPTRRFDALYADNVTYYMTD